MPWAMSISPTLSRTTSLACNALPGTAARSDVAGRTLLASALGSLRRVEVGRHRFEADRPALSLRPDQGLEQGEALGMARSARLAPPGGTTSVVRASGREPFLVSCVKVIDRPILLLPPVTTVRLPFKLLVGL